MLIRDGEEPTKVCDHCAHAMLSDIADVVLNYHPTLVIGAVQLILKKGGF
jgi:hypothetical protein